MDIRKLQRAIVDGLEDVKGQNIVVFNTEHLSPLFERVVIASGTSNRQTKALAASVRDAVKSSGFPILRTEGEGNGEWIIVDCGAAVVHLMQPSIREYYHLEEIWGDKPVRLKLDTAPLRLVKAAEPDAEKAPRSARETAAKAAGKTAAPRRPAAARASVDDDTSPAKAAARKLPAKAAARQLPGKAAARQLPGKAAVRRPAAPVARASGDDETAATTRRSPAEAKPPVKRAAGARQSTGVTRTVGVKTKPPASRSPAARKAAAKKPADSA